MARPRRSSAAAALERVVHPGGRARGVAGGGVCGDVGRVATGPGRRVRGDLRRRPRRPYPLRRIHVLVAVSPAVAEEHLVDGAAEPALYAAQLAVPRRGRRAATEAAVRAHGRRRLQVPLARVPCREGLVVEDAGRADLDQVATELALESAALGAPEVDPVAQPEDAEVAASRVVVVEARAAVAGDATVELVGHERAEVLVLEGAFEAPVPAVAVTGHHRHVLEVAFAALVADRAVVRVAEHHQLDHLGAEADRLLVLDVDPRALVRLGHAGHRDLALLVALAICPVEANGALAAGADGPQDGVPAEEREIEAQREGDVEHVPAFFRLVVLPVDDHRHETRRGCFAATAHQTVSFAVGASAPRRR